MENGEKNGETNSSELNREGDGEQGVERKEDHKSNGLCEQEVAKRYTQNGIDEEEQDLDLKNMSEEQERNLDWKSGL